MQPKENIQSRQSLLEQLIAQSRSLIQQLDKAQGREEKNSILRNIREINRCVEYFNFFSFYIVEIRRIDVAMKAPSAQLHCEKRFSSSYDSPWPTMTESSMILELSDDEDSES